MNPLNRLPNYDNTQYKLFYWSIIVTVLIGGSYLFMGQFLSEDCNPSICLEAMESKRDLIKEGIDDEYFYSTLQEKYGISRKNFEKYAREIIKTSNDEIIKGLGYMAINDFDSALTSFNEAIDINSKNQNAWYNRGVVLMYKGENEKAIEAFNISNEINETFASYINLGVSLNNQGKYEEAIEYHKKAIEIDPGYSNGWNNLGIALANLGEYEEALKAFEKSTSILDHESSWANIGNIYILKNDSEKAIEAFNRALQLNPEYSSALKGMRIATKKLN